MIAAATGRTPDRPDMDETHARTGRAGLLGEGGDSVPDHARVREAAGKYKVGQTRHTLATLALDAVPVDLATCGTNEGLGFGRFSTPGLVVRGYSFRASAEEIVATFSEAFDALVGEMRVDDLSDGNPSPLQRIGYPTLRAAFDHPKALGEVIETFLGRDILARFVPFSDNSRFVLNSIHTVSVSEAAVVLEGTCFATHS